MSFPTPKLLVKCRRCGNLSINNCQQRQVPSQINILAPVPDHLCLGDTMLYEHAFSGGNGQKKLVKAFFIILAQGAEPALGAVLKRNIFRILLEFKFKRHTLMGLAGNLPELVSECKGTAGLNAATDRGAALLA